MVLFDEYVNKKVVIILRNGFRKFGLFLAYDADFISIKFNDGRAQLISRQEIGEIFLDKKIGGALP